MPTISPRSTLKRHARQRSGAQLLDLEYDLVVVRRRPGGSSAAGTRVSSASNSSPASSSTIPAWSKSLTGPAPTTMPSRNTETLCATRKTSPRWWVTYSTPTPVAAIALTRSSRWSTSSTGSVAVGSSSTSRHAGYSGSSRRARAMATPVRSDALSVATSACGSMSRLSLSRSVLGLLVGGLPVDRPERGGKAGPERHVVQDRQRRDESEILLHEPASEPVGLHGRLEWQVLTLDPDTTARIGRVVSGEDLDQGRLPRSVLPQEGVNLAGLDGHADACQRLGTSECLRHSSRLRELRSLSPPGVCHLLGFAYYWTCQSFWN